MSILKRLRKNTAVTPQYKVLTVDRNNFYSYDGKLYKSESVRAAIRPFVLAVGKLSAKHIRETITADERKIEVNPEPYMRFLLEEPNPYMTGQGLQERLAMQYMLNSNAFALIVWDAMGMPQQIYPIPCYGVTAYPSDSGLMMEFSLKKGSIMRVPYESVIHIGQDFGSNYMFGESPAQSLLMLMETMSVMDQGLVKAIKNSGVIRWLLKFNKSLRPDDIKKNVKDFVSTYLDLESDTFGAAGVDVKTDATRIEPKDYVPNAAVQDRVYERVLNFFNTNKDIVQSKATEEQWEAYFEQVVEPVAIKLSNEFTRKLFSRRQRGCGNKIYFESANLQHASITTKLNMREMVDRGALTPNEWRAVFNYAPVAGGDQPLRRLDTGVVKEGGDEGEGTN